MSFSILTSVYKLIGFDCSLLVPPLTLPVLHVLFSLCKTCRFSVSGIKPPPCSSVQYLPLCHFIDFKHFWLTFKVLNGLALTYLSVLVNIHTPLTSLWSTSKYILDVLKLKHRAFDVAAPRQ
ncbi:hypothetical protein ILYODFUR_003731 [Ilyodon furcidens]|uniref:Uncharacterized protein n=1 Tax=Ilyodon furcidens TaxID=33524 RepID=A0ABV0U474_9TELE